MARNLIEEQIPDSWTYDLLDRLTERVSGHTPSKSYPEYWNGGIKWISLADTFRLDNGYVYETDKEISQEGLNNSSAQLHPAETVVLSRDAGIGKSGVMAEPMAVSQHFIAWKCDNEKKMNSWFLYNWLQFHKSEFERQAVGSTIKTIGLPFFKKLKIAAPPYKEQRKIAQILSTWDKAISTTERLIDNSKYQKKALMQQLLTGKKRLLDDSGKRFDGEWDEKRISELGEISSGGTPSTSKPEYWDGNITWVTPTDITKQDNIYIESSVRQVSLDGVKNSSAKLLPKGTLLVCTRATIGEMAVSSHEMSTNQGFKNIVPNENTNIEFVYYLLNFYKHKLISKASGSTFLELSKSAFEQMEFHIPEYQEQHKIATVLLKADHEIDILRQQLADLKHEKKALMQQLLTGKRRVITSNELELGNKKEKELQQLKIKNLTLKNYRAFESFKMNFSDSNVTVIIGNNGVGKSSILEATALSLSGLIAKIRTKNGKAANISQADIRNEEVSATLEVKLDDLRTSSPINYHWIIAGTRVGLQSNESGSYTQLNYLAENFRNEITSSSEASLPLIVLYGVDRVTKGVKMNFLESKTDRFEAYESPPHKSASCNEIFDWIHYRDNIQNEKNIGLQSLKALEQNLRDSGLDENSIRDSIELVKYREPVLLAVKSAISKFIPEISEIGVEREPEVRIFLIKNDTKVYIDQLSQGEKGIFCLVADISRRLSILNPHLKDPLKGGGVVLIDEVELHLHPAWQQKIIENLTTCFPNIQFILTSHSPQVLTTVKNKDIRLFELEDGVGNSKVPLGKTYAEASGDLLERVMNVDSRPPIPQVVKFREYMKFVDSGAYNTEDALKLRSELESLLGEEHPDLLKADRSIKRQEFLS
ncbi:type I restriction-modification system, specificity subunit S [Pseudoalteromonas distincta]|uniref:restriction endonuclease subunit S n=1 Tax=Pseudoalteromonas distincta TaxID=77608 RepID=UPI00020A0CC4|nr:restriction endonuclease subunit S [Pseudoalteromonas distincta]EGI71500.1 type I restriction-modification system, specificity subunit S [Pseudoalteromonas distincta]